MENCLGKVAFQTMSAFLNALILNLGRMSLCCFAPSVFLNGGNDSKKGEWELWSTDTESGKMGFFYDQDTFHLQVNGFLYNLHLF